MADNPIHTIQKHYLAISLKNFLCQRKIKSFPSLLEYIFIKLRSILQFPKNQLKFIELVC